MTPVIFLFVAQIVFADGTELDLKYRGSSAEDCQQIAMALTQALYSPQHAKLHVVSKCVEMPAEVKT